MKVYIPTKGRPWGLQHTVASLGGGPLTPLDEGPDQLDEVYLVHPHDEDLGLDLAPSLGRVRTLPCPARGISATRQWVLDLPAEPGEVIMMLDDDLRYWGVPSPMAEGKYLAATPVEVWEGLHTLVDAMHEGGFVHGGIGPRAGAIYRNEWESNTRMIRALAYVPSELERIGVRFRLPVMEDFDLALQLLRAGYPSVQYSGLVQSQGASNTAGGCSSYRTAEVQAAAARSLEVLHPGLVTVVQRNMKTGEGFWSTRTDVRISWKKALGAGWVYGEDML